jgi:hypothetical protein
MLLLEQREIWGANRYLSPSEVTFGERLQVYGIATPFNVGGVEVNGVDRFVMERAQIKAILNFCKSRKLSCIDGDRAVDSEEDFHDFTHNTPQGAEKLGTYIGERLLKILK